MSTNGIRNFASLIIALTAVSTLGCRRSTAAPPTPSALPVSAIPRNVLKPPTKPETAEVIYDGAFKNSWQDWGWGPHEAPPNAPLRVRFDNWGGLILAKPGNTGEFGGVSFRIAIAKDQVSFLGLRLESENSKLPDVPLSEEHTVDAGDGWTEVFVPAEQLNPDGYTVVDRVIFHSRRLMGPEFIAIDKVYLTKPSIREPVEYDLNTLPQAPIAIQCKAKATRISPYIFGFAYNGFDDANAAEAQWQLEGTARRWGGNPTSTYNWEIDAWNTGNDWYYENHSITTKQFFSDNEQHGIVGALTIPMMGWVSKDTTSHSFPVSEAGAQQATDPYRPDAGNGKGKDGKLLAAGPQSRAYKQVTPEFVKRWVESIRKQDAAKGRRSIWMYILDNEPMIWNTTHRDAHPEPLSYDELLKRTIDYGTAIRQADPEAVIAGPAEWGWTNFMYSAVDMAKGGEFLRLDRRAHGDLPVVAYYLKALAEHERKTGTRILDVLDLHVYPTGDGVYGPKTDPSTAALRIRSTRMLWDKTYVDEAWVKEPMYMMLRMREWVDSYYPGRGLSIGEWNFGAERHISGGLATAEALGRFAQFGLTSAFYWTYPAKNSPASIAFRAFRNFDGKGSRFLDWYTPSVVDPNSGVSVFASRNESGNHLVAVLLNLSQKHASGAAVDVGSCGTAKTVQVYSYDSHSGGLTARKVAA